MSVMHLERARDLDEAAAIIGGAGMPGQNVMIADTAGRIGWVLSGRLPRRAGIDPLRPSPWNADGAGWDGWLPQAESPRLLDPPQGYAWSANARVVGGEAYARIGDGDYAPAARARQIRDRLASLPNATPADMLAIQLDDRAEFAAHWQPILEQALRRAGEAEAARLVAGWSGHAAVDDAGYRLVREFERNVSARAFEALAAPAIARWPDFRWRAPQRFTDVARRLVEARPPNLLDPRFADWDAWLADVAKNTAEDLPKQCADLASCTWGRINVAANTPPDQCGRAFPLRIPRHAGRTLAGRLVHAARAIARFRCVRALQRLARPRDGGLPAHARRSERPPAVAVLSRGSCGLGGGARDTFPAGSRGSRPQARAERGVMMASLGNFGGIHDCRNEIARRDRGGH